jgi:hypothetical protein
MKMFLIYTLNARPLPSSTTVPGDMYRCMVLHLLLPTRNLHMIHDQSLIEQETLGNRLSDHQPNRRYACQLNYIRVHVHVTNSKCFDTCLLSDSNTNTVLALLQHQITTLAMHYSAFINGNQVACIHPLS